jgi:hypothetical protein
MSKLFTEVNARLDSNDKFEPITFDCNNIIAFKRTGTGTTELTLSVGTIEVDMDYYEFQQNVMGEILKVEHQTDILQLMAGYLANNLVCNIPPETLIKDCKGIIQKIASENNSI